MFYNFEQKIYAPTDIKKYLKDKIVEKLNEMDIESFFYFNSDDKYSEKINYFRALKNTILSEKFSIESIDVLNNQLLLAQFIEKEFNQLKEVIGNTSINVIINTNFNEKVLDSSVNLEKVKTNILSN